MPRGNLLERMTVSVSVGAGIVVLVVGAMAWFFEKIPSKTDIESNEAMSLRISAWVKEELVKVDYRQASSEARVTQVEGKHHEEILRRLEVIEGVERDILSRLPRKLAAVF